MKIILEVMVTGAFVSAEKAFVAASWLPPVRRYLSEGDFSVSIRTQNGSPSFSIKNASGRISCGKVPDEPGLALVFRDTRSMVRTALSIIAIKEWPPFSLPEEFMKKILAGDLEISGEPREVLALAGRAAPLFRHVSAERISGASPVRWAGRLLAVLSR